MKYGKSLLLSELISAKEVGYEDVRKNRFWIGCSVCNEAIFKVVRQTGDSAVVQDPATHYFSHYEASRSYVTDCELRVGRITEDAKPASFCQLCPKHLGTPTADETLLP